MNRLFYRILPNSRTWSLFLLNRRNRPSLANAKSDGKWSSLKIKIRQESERKGGRTDGSKENSEKTKRKKKEKKKKRINGGNRKNRKKGNKNGMKNMKGIRNGFKKRDNKKKIVQIITH
jgi:hypothetical protein